MATESALTTVDNPYSPFDEFDEWLAFDERLGYYSTSLLARIANVSLDLSVPDQRKVINDAIDEIINENVSGMHRKVTREVVGT